MKKNSKVLRKDYSKLENDITNKQYYGLFVKKGRVKIDTKRYKKFFTLPNNKIERRKTVYYTPTKICREDYLCNIFRDELRELKRIWFNEFEPAINAIKTPKDVAETIRSSSMMNGILEPGEASAMGFFAGIKREKKYTFVIKSLYAQFFQQMMSHIDALSLKVIVSRGYKYDDFSKKLFDNFIQEKQKTEKPVDFSHYDNYEVYDRAYLVWNFLKHNSKRSYDELKRKFPKMIHDPDGKYENGNLALTVLRLDKGFILNCLDNMHKFFDEVCQKGFYENTEDANWDYDEYFYQQVQYEIDSFVNPLGLPAWI